MPPPIRDTLITTATPRPLPGPADPVGGAFPAPVHAHSKWRDHAHPKRRRTGTAAPDRDPHARRSGARLVRTAFAQRHKPSTHTTADQHEPAAGEQIDHSRAAATHQAIAWEPRRTAVRALIPLTPGDLARRVIFACAGIRARSLCSRAHAGVASKAGTSSATGAIKISHARRARPAGLAPAARAYTSLACTVIACTSRMAMLVARARCSVSYPAS